MGKRKLIASLVLCAGTPVLAQVNDGGPQNSARQIQPDRAAPFNAATLVDPASRPSSDRDNWPTPEAPGDPVAGPYSVENGGNNGQLGVEHAFGHYWITARDTAATNHKIWKYDEAGNFVKAFDQDIASKATVWGYYDGASDEGANQLYFGYDCGGFAVHDYDPATGDISVHCTQTIPDVGTIRALARTPSGTFLTKSWGGTIYEFDMNGATINSWPDPGISAFGCAYDVASETYWWHGAGGIVIETDTSMVLTGNSFSGAQSMTSFLAQGGMDIYADPRSATGSAFVVLGQGIPDEIAIYEAPAGSSGLPSTGPVGCDAPPTPPLSDCSLETLFASNNSGDVGGVVFMDVTVGDEDLTIQGLEVNTSVLSCQAPFQIEIWTRPLTYIGGECIASEWTLAAVGNGIGQGVDQMSQVVFPSPPTFTADETFGVALVGIGTEHRYTNGTGTNETYSNDFMTLQLGAAQNAPFSCPTFSPRVWNGRFYYTPTWGCEPCPPCACDFDTSTGPETCDLFDFLAFQNAFVTGDPCAVDLNTTTGKGVADLFDFLDFQNSFVGGPCP